MWTFCKRKGEEEEERIVLGWKDSAFIKPHSVVIMVTSLPG
jgi:hypothetical protein